MKDAASAAIYGAQAANGVLLVTTKTGNDGPSKVTFDGYMGWESVARKIDMCNAQQYMTLMDEQALNSGDAAYNWSNYSSIYDSNGNINNTNWIDKMFKNNAKTQNYTVGINGGTATSSYAVSLGYYSQEGIVGGSSVSNYERYNVHANMEQKLYGDFLKVGEIISMSYTKNKGIGTGNMYNNKLRGAYSSSPLQSLYLQNDGRADLNNGYGYSIASDWYQYDGNPVASLYRGNNINDGQNWVANVYAEIQPVKNLKIKSQMGYNYSSSSYRSYSPDYVSTTNDMQTSGSTAYQSMYKGWSLTWTNTATYDWKMGLHAFNAMIGIETERSQGDNMNGTNTLLSVYDQWSTAYLSNAKNTSSGTVYGYPSEDYHRVSYFGRIGWNYNETYI